MRRFKFIDNGQMLLDPTGEYALYYPGYEGKRYDVAVRRPKGQDCIREVVVREDGSWIRVDDNKQIHCK